MFNIEKLDPRTKIVMIVSISTAAMLVKDIWFLLGLLLFLVAFLALGKVSLKQQFIQGKAALGMVVFLFILQTLFGRMELGAMLCIRLMILIISAMILLTGKPRDYLLGLIQWKMPYEIAYMLLIALHFFPLLKEEALDVYYSVQFRGTEVKKTSLPKKLSVYKSICLPILAGAMERVKDTSIAMEARAFRTRPRRTYMRKLKLNARDWVLIIVFPLLATGFYFVNYQMSATPPEQIILSVTDTPSTSQAVSWYSHKEYNGFAVCAGNKTIAKCTEIRKGEYYRYKALMSGLKAGETYEYQVGNRWVKSEKKSFNTASLGDVRFLYMGDIQYQVREEGYRKWQKMLNSAIKNDPSVQFGIFGGDMVERSGDIDDWSSFFQKASPVFAEIPMATVPGNHEISILPYTYKQMLPLPRNGPRKVEGEVYSFNYGDVHIVALNSGLFMKERIGYKGENVWREIMQDVNMWIRDDLQAAQEKYKIIVMHHPMYPVTSDDDIYERIRANWEQIFSESGVDLIFCGHQHIFMRTKEINEMTQIMSDAGDKKSYYFKSGEAIPDYAEKIYEGNTYQIISAEDKGLSVTTYNNKNKEIDHWIRSGN